MIAQRNEQHLLEESFCFRRSSSAFFATWVQSEVVCGENWWYHCQLECFKSANRLVSHTGLVIVSVDDTTMAPNMLLLTVRYSQRGCGSCGFEEYMLFAVSVGEGPYCPMNNCARFPSCTSGCQSPLRNRLYSSVIVRVNHPPNSCGTDFL